MATRVTGNKFKTYFTPWFSYDVTVNNATTYTFKINLGVTSTKTTASQYGSGSRIRKRIGNGAWASSQVGHTGNLPANSDTTIMSNDVWAVTKTHSAQTVTIEGAVSVLESGTDVGYATKTFTVPAKTSYTVTFNANSGSGAPTAQTKWYDEALTLSSAKPTKSGYTFKGWATSEAHAKVGTVDYASGATVEANTNSALNLWAVWELTYSKPTITNLHVERCDAQGVADDEGTLALVTFDWSVFRSSATRYYNGTTTPYASTTVQSCSVAVGSETATPTLTGASGSASVVVGSAGSFLTDTQYNASVTITDTVDSAIQPSHSSTATGTLSTTFFPMDFNQDASALGFFRPAPDSGDGVYFGKPIHVTGGIEASGNLSVAGHYTSAITACGATGTADLVLSTSEKQVNLNSNRAIVGADLTNDNSGGVKCAKSGYVEVSGTIYCTTGFTANDYVHLVIRRGSTLIINAVHRIPNNYDYFGVTPIVYSVSAGDILYLYAYNQSGARGQISAATGSWLTVKYL